MKAFKLAAREHEEGQDEPIEFSLVDPDGEEDVYTILPPTTSQIASLVAVAADRRSEPEELIPELYRILEQVMEREDYLRIRDRFEDRNDPLEVEHMLEMDDGEPGILDYIIEQASGGRPTRPSSGSRRSPGNGGRRSTARSRSGGSTRSTSRRAGSSTSSTPGPSSE